MDFSFTEEQIQIKELANQILNDNSNDDFHRNFSKSSPSKNKELYSQTLWGLFAEAGLLGIAVPETFGGSSFGLIELCQILEEQGRFVSPIPLIPSLIYGGLTLARYGSDTQKKTYLSKLANGEIIISAAIAEDSICLALRKKCTAKKEGEQWLLNGANIAVPFAEQAAVILVPAEIISETDSKKNKSIALFLVKPNEHVSYELTNSGNHEPLYSVDYNEAPAELLGTEEQGEEILQFILNNGMVANCAVMIGITEDALRRTAEYTAERKQFGTTIASFQNTTMKLADCYIDIECLRSTYYEALWKMSEGLSADAEIKVAKYWACTAGHRVAHITQHLHGGIGSDVDYPLHRYYLWFKQMELTLGGRSKQLSDLGILLASDHSINLLPETT